MTVTSKIGRMQNVVLTTGVALFVLSLFATFLTGRMGFLNVGMALVSIGILLAFVCFSVDLVINEWREKHFLLMAALIAIYGGILFGFGVGPFMLLDALHSARPSPPPGYTDPYSQWFKTGMIITALGTSLWLLAIAHAIARNAPAKRPVWKALIPAAVAIVGAALLVVCSYHLIVNIQKLWQ